MSPSVKPNTATTRRRVTGAIVRAVSYALIGAGFVVIAFGLAAVYRDQGFAGLQLFLSPYNIVGYAMMLLTLAPGLLLLYLAGRIDGK
jgi:hypothetical protein